MAAARVLDPCRRGLILALVVCLLLVRFSSRYRPALILVTAFLGLRLVLTGNPWVWDAYTRTCRRVMLGGASSHPRT